MEAAVAEATALGLGAWAGALLTAFFFFVVTTVYLNFFVKILRRALSCPVAAFSRVRDCTKGKQIIHKNFKKNEGGGKPGGIEEKGPPVSAASAFFDAGIGIVIVDAFEVFRLHLVPGDIAMGIEFDGHVSHQVLDKDRVFVGAFGDGFFVLPF